MGIYCGITNDPARRAGEHAQNKKFNVMTAAGKTTEKQARKYEKECVCMHDPILTHKPTCEISAPRTNIFTGQGLYKPKPLSKRYIVYR